MYNSYFGFSESPFENILDKKFLYLSDAHEEVLASLLYFVRERKTFAMICGDIGTGKTMLIHSFISMVPEYVMPILITNPDVGHLEILYYLAQRLGVTRANKTVLQLHDDIKTRLLAAEKEGIRCVLIVDEAHLLSDRSLEHIRLLSNIETQRGSLIQILLAGQYELSRRLSGDNMKQLRQRININRFLSAMNSEETIKYVDHRLSVVGSCLDACFENECINLLYRMTGGVPRQINQLCDNALLICMTQKAPKVNGEILKMANDALRTDLVCIPESGKQKGQKRETRISPKTLQVIVGILVLLIVLMLAYKAFSEKDFIEWLRKLLR